MRTQRHRVLLLWAKLQDDSIDRELLQQRKNRVHGDPRDTDRAQCLCSLHCYMQVRTSNIAISLILFLYLATISNTLNTSSMPQRYGEPRCAHGGPGGDSPALPQGPCRVCPGWYTCQTPNINLKGFLCR